MSDWDTWRDEFETLLWLSYGISADELDYEDVLGAYESGYNPHEAIEQIMDGD